MADYVTEIIEQGDRLWSDRASLEQFWQESAEMFCPDVANFTRSSTLGDDYGSDLATSYTLLVMRELTDQIGAMLRPSIKDAAVMYVEGLEDYAGKAWLDEAMEIQRRAMHDRRAQYTVAAKQFERDLCGFGNAVMTIDAMPDKSGLLFRRWHLRDVVWSDGIHGMHECVHRRWNPSAYELKRTFGAEKLHQEIRNKLERDKDPYCKTEIRHVIVPIDMYGGPDKYRTKFVSLYIDVTNKHVIESRGLNESNYVIARWHRIDGTQYGASPAVIAGLSEGRTLQAMTWTLLEAGEKHANPPLIATEGMIRGGLNVRAGDVTIVSADYDERTGAVLRPLLQDKSGMPLGLELQNRSEAFLRKAFYADKLQMPVADGTAKTATEVTERVRQYLRDAAPLVEPLEIEVNGATYERTFSVLMQEMAFGPAETIPPSLSNANVEFKFASPLREHQDRQKASIFLEGVNLIQAGAALDPAVQAIPNATKVVREALEGLGWETEWTTSPEEVAAAAAQDAQDAQAQQMLDAMGQASGIAKNFSQAQAVPAQ